MGTGLSDRKTASVAKNHAFSVLLCCAFCVVLLCLVLFPEQVFGQQPSSTSVCESESVFAEIHNLLESHTDHRAEALIAEVRNCPNLTAVGRFKLGWAYAESGDFNAALQQLNSVGRDVPTEAVHTYAVAMVELRLHDYDATIKMLQPLQEQNALDESTANLLGVAEAKAGRYQAAYDVFRKEIARQPKDLLAYLNAITLLSDAGKFADAAQIVDDALQAFPKNPQIMISAGAVDELQGKDQEALVRFDSVVRAEPHNADARFLLAATNYDMGRYEAAKKDIEQSIQDGVVSSDLYYLLAECELKTNPTSSSGPLTAVSHAIQLNGKSVPSLVLRGKLLLEEDRPGDALQDLVAAHRLDPSSHNATYNLARCYSALGKREEAARLYHNLEPGSEDSVARLSRSKAQEALAGGGSR